MKFRKGQIPWNKGKKGLYKVTEETKKKLSEINMGKHLSEETKKKCSEGKKREKNYRWKGGIKNHRGYLQFKVPEGCRFSCMKGNNGYIAIQRLTVAAFLQRPLKTKEIVHHINGNIIDDRIENLELLNRSKHTSIHNRLRK